MIVARGITVINRVDPEMKSLPMFRSELVTVFLNLVTNAIKAAGEDGRISASGRVEETDRGEVVRVTIQNTGDRVALEESERWFRPFETTTVDLNPVLGQGMGLGLPITRELLGEYGGTVRFVTPRAPYTTAIEVALPTRRR
jgi:signal transduction histidine kinase